MVDIFYIPHRAKYCVFFLLLLLLSLISHMALWTGRERGSFCNLPKALFIGPQNTNSHILLPCVLAEDLPYRSWVPLGFSQSMRFFFLPSTSVWFTDGHITKSEPTRYKMLAGAPEGK